MNTKNIMNYTVLNASVMEEEQSGYGRELLQRTATSVFSKETRSKIAHLSVLETIA